MENITVNNKELIICIPSAPILLILVSPPKLFTINGRGKKFSK